MMSHAHLRASVRRLSLWLRGRPSVPLRRRRKHWVTAGLDGLRQGRFMLHEKRLLAAMEVGQHFGGQLLDLLKCPPPFAALSRQLDAAYLEFGKAIAPP